MQNGLYEKERGRMSINWAKNVGTDGNPVSYLHERAVALLYDELKTNDEVRVRLADGTLSHNIREGMAELKVPDEWTNIGGVVPDVVPDLVMYGEDGTPIRIIEVTVTSPPSKQKRGQLNTLAKRGVDVVEVVVCKSEDLMTLCWTPVVPYYSWRNSNDRYSINLAQQSYSSNQKAALDGTVEQFAQAIRGCSPKARRVLHETLKGLGSLESLFPVRGDNPKAEMLKTE